MARMAILTSLIFGEGFFYSLLQIYPYILKHLQPAFGHKEKPLTHDVSRAYFINFLFLPITDADLLDVQ